MSDEAPGVHGPPSAAGHLEPYGARIVLRPEERALRTDVFLQDLLERIAASCVAAGATLIGHLKCVLHTDEGSLLCNLTSVRSGAVCRGDGQRTLAPGKEAKLDLAVLVYGLSAEVVDGLAADALGRLLDPDGVYWDKGFSIHSSHS